MFVREGQYTAQVTREMPWRPWSPCDYKGEARQFSMYHQKKKKRRRQSLSWVGLSQAKSGSWQTSQKICLCALDKAGQKSCDPEGRQKEIEKGVKQGDEEADRKGYRNRKQRFK